MEFLDDEELSICLMKDHEEDEVTLYFSYHDLFCICKKLNNEPSKLYIFSNTFISF